MRRRLLVAAVVAAAGLATLAPASAHGDYTGGWTDPAPGTELDGLRSISGTVSHPHGIEAVSLLLVSPVEEQPPECEAGGGPFAPVQGNGAMSVSFSFPVVFPCNVMYQVAARAQAGAGEGTSLEPDPAPGPYDMPLVVAVAIPPDPVDDVGVFVDDDGDDVTITWSPNREPDLLRYEVLRDGEVIGEVGADDDLRFVDDDPPRGTTATYEVVAVRQGPRDDDVKASPSGESVEVPDGEDADDDEDGTDDGDEGDEDADEDEDDGEGDEDGDGDGGSLGTSSGTGGGGGQPGSVGISTGPSGGGAGGPPTTADTGFSDVLPFAGGQGVAAPPSGDGSVVASFDDAEDTPLFNQETWTFIAAGLALLMGSMVIRHVTRRAAAGY